MTQCLRSTTLKIAQKLATRTSSSACGATRAFFRRRWKMFKLSLWQYEFHQLSPGPLVLTTMLQAYRAQEESEPSLCRIYVSTARTMCQTLGYHRESSYRNDTPEVAQSKRHVFYSLYTIDKNLSLVLGQSSNFNDNDIDAEPFTVSTNPRQWPWDLYTHICYRFAKIQGDIYNDLYSASATKHSQHKRLCYVDELSTRINNLRDELQSVLLHHYKILQPYLTNRSSIHAARIIRSCCKWLRNMLTSSSMRSYQSCTELKPASPMLPRYQVDVTKLQERASRAIFNTLPVSKTVACTNRWTTSKSEPLPVAILLTSN